MSDNKDASDLALAHLYAQCEAQGVAALKCTDGEMFMFSRKTVEMLKEKIDASDQDRIMIFVKTGPTLVEN